MKILAIVYDNDSFIHCFPLGLAYILSYCKQQGHSITVYNQDVYHYSSNHLKEYLDKNKFDVICMGIITGYYQYKKLLEISEAINNSRTRHGSTYILGGHGVSPDPKYFLEKTKADYIIMGEGEITIQEILNGTKAKDIDGIAYLDGDYKINPRRKPIKNVDDILYPSWEYFPIDYYALNRGPGCYKNSDRSMVVISGRGCPYQCNFCYRMEKGFRPRTTESIIEEIKLLKKLYNINVIEFTDELLMSSKNRTVDICETIIKENLNIKWVCNGRLNIVDLELAKLMKKSGCMFINYGIESLDDKTLEIMNKKLTVSQIIKGIEATIKAQIIPGLNVIFGNIGETEQILKKGVAFLKKYNDGSQLRTIRPVTPYPGSPLYYHAIQTGLLKDSRDFYENKHLNSDLLSVNFTKLSDEKFYDVLKNANLELINDYYEKNKNKCIEQTENLYTNKDATFRGFRTV